MKIDAKILKEYIKKVTMNNDMMTFNLNFTENGVTSSLKGIENVTMTIGKLNKEAFETYETIGEIFIRNSVLMTTMLDSFKDIIEIEKVEDYALKISENKREVFIMLGEEQTCDNIIRKEKPELDSKINLNLFKKDLTPVIKDMATLKINKIDLHNENKFLTFSVGSKNDSEHTNNIVQTDIDEKVKVSVGKSIKSFYDSLTDGFVLKIGNDIPLLFIETTPLMTIETYIAPMVK